MVWIATNAGKQGEVIVQAVLANDNVNYGYNAATDEYVDMVAAGVIDPTKVVRTALENSSSVAGMLLTTEAIVTDKPDEDKD